MCCESCQIEDDICADYNLFIQSANFGNCTHAVESVNGDCSTILEEHGVRLDAVCCASCESASICRDYPTFIEPYYHSCLNALIANGGECSAQIEVPTGVVTLSDVCCSSCDVWNDYSSTCVDYDEFLFQEVYETCAEAVTNLHLHGKTCDQTIGSGTYRGTTNTFHRYYYRSLL